MFAAVLAGCSTGLAIPYVKDVTEEVVTVQHGVFMETVPEWSMVVAEAERACGAYGKRAVFIKSWDHRGVYFTLARDHVFACGD